MARSPTSGVSYALMVGGMHRSGTSAMARVLALAGGALPDRVIDPAPDNPLGYWEPVEMVGLDDAILSAVGSNWDDVFCLGAAEQSLELEGPFQEQAEAFLRGQAGQRLVLKDPRASILTPFWTRALSSVGREPIHVIMVRSPVEVAGSLAKRNGFPFEKSMLLWASYMLAVERDTRGQARLFVGYDDLLSDWRSVLARIDAFTSSAPAKRTKAMEKEIDAFLSGDQRHHVANQTAEAVAPGAWSGVDLAFDWFRTSAAGGVRDPSELDALRVELERISAAVSPAIDDLRRRATRQLALEGEIASARAEAEAQQRLLNTLHARADAAEQEVIASRRLAQEQISALEQALTFWRLEAQGEGAKVEILAGQLAGQLAEARVLAHRALEQEGLAAALKEQVAAVQGEKSALLSSTSWRITRPLRGAIRLLRGR